MYSIEYAKSSRSQCKKCKEKIAKDELRIVTSRFYYFLGLFGILNRLSHVQIELYIRCVVFLLIGAYSETRDMDFVR